MRADPALRGRGCHLNRRRLSRSPHGPHPLDRPAQTLHPALVDPGGPARGRATLEIRASCLISDYERFTSVFDAIAASSRFTDRTAAAVPTAPARSPRPAAAGRRLMPPQRAGAGPGSPSPTSPPCRATSAVTTDGGRPVPRTPASCAARTSRCCSPSTSWARSARSPPSATAAPSPGWSASGFLTLDGAIEAAGEGFMRPIAEAEEVLALRGQAVGADPVPILADRDGRLHRLRCAGSGPAGRRRDQAPHLRGDVRRARRPGIPGLHLGRGPHPPGQDDRQLLVTETEFTARVADSLRPPPGAVFGSDGDALAALWAEPWFVWEVTSPRWG